MVKGLPILTLALILGAFWLSSDALARVAWGKYGQANVALALNRSDTDIFMQLGNYYFGGGAYDLERAKEAYRSALEIEEGILWGHYQLARIYFVEGSFTQALQEINLELEHNPENFRSYYVRGLIYGYRGYYGDLTKAEEDFKRFIETAYNEWAGYNDLAWILLQEEKYRETVRVIQKAFEQIPDTQETNPWLWNSLGVAELNLQNYAEARRDFEKALAIAEEMPLAEWQSAYPGNRREDSEQGFEAFKAALQQNLKKTEQGKK